MYTYPAHSKLQSFRRHPFQQFLPYLTLLRLLIIEMTFFHKYSHDAVRLSYVRTVCAYHSFIFHISPNLQQQNNELTRFNATDMWRYHVVVFKDKVCKH